MHNLFEGEKLVRFLIAMDDTKRKKFVLENEFKISGNKI